MSRRIGLLALAFSLFAAALTAQSRAIVTGSVVDAQLKPLAGVVVTLERDGRSQATSTTDANGAFAFRDVQPGSYLVRATFSGYPVFSKRLTVTARATSLQLPLAGQPSFGETAFFHPASSTLIGADLFANLPPTNHLWTRAYCWATGLGPKPSTNLVMRSAVKDRAAARRSLDAMIARAPERVIIAHGTAVESGGADALREAWAWLK